MKKVLDDLCDYRRYCWNQGLALWNDMYDASLILEDKELLPNERNVRDELVADKADWQYQLSARCLQLAFSDLGKAWKNFLNKAQPDCGKPQFKSKKAPRQGFKTDRAKLVNNYDQIAIEDLDVKRMLMSHVASKGLQRSLFGCFRQVLAYKCQWYGRELFLADKFYPGTQRCSRCGFVKTGDDKISLDGNMKHKTRHNEYVCYECGAVMDRDENAVMNLMALI
ncbi:MAG: transposase [Ligilactobacillus ruminis]|nr:transposase [Ligilactobacillus ruminis]